MSDTALLRPGKLQPRTVRTVLLFVLMFVYALSVTMVGPMVPVLLDEYSLRLSQGGLIAIVQNLGGFAAIVLGAWIGDRLRKPLLITTAAFGYSIALLATGLGGSYGGLLAIFFLIGSATKIVDTMSNAYLADLQPERRARYLPLLHASFGIGAVAGPLYARMLLDHHAEWRTVFVLLGVVSMVVSILLAIGMSTRGETANGKRPAVRAGGLRLAAEGRLVLLAVLLFLYMGHQAALVMWFPTYLERVSHASAFLASFALSLFWAGIVAGRFAASLLSRRVEPMRLMRWGSLASGIALVAAFASRDSALSTVSATFAGFLTGAVVPLVVSIACDWYPSQSGFVTSYVFLYGTAAYALVPWGIGAIADSAGMAVGMAGAGALLVAFFAITLALPQKEHRRATSQQP